jgi:hypothetical protein
MVSVDCVCQKGVCAQTLTVFIQLFLPVTIRDWNNLPKDALSVKLVPSLKKILQQTDGQKTNHVYIMFGGFSMIHVTLFAEFAKRNIILE